MNLPNKLTVARIVMVPVFVALMSFPSTFTYLAAWIVFVAASYTDYLDGKIARARGLITTFGKLMDPLADKVLTSAAYIMLMTVPELYVPGWCIVAIIAREFLVTGARSLAAGDGQVIAASLSGKLKTILQIGYIGCILGFTVLFKLLGDALPNPELAFELLWQASWYGAVAVAAVTLWSGLRFALDNWRALNLGDA